MPAVADNNKSILFANLNYYALVERRGLTISRNPYLYQANGQIGIFCSVRFGGAVLQSEAVKWGVQV
jgi:HK97 family phage major capsid protein